MKETTCARRRAFPGGILAGFFLFLLTGFSQAGNFNTVVIDPGHGGRDVGGKYGKVYEKHLALDTAFRLQHELRRWGLRTVMTRQSDQFISLGRRAAIGNSYPNSIFVSIHYNFTWKRDVRGLETFYYSRRSKALAENIQQGMLRRTGAANRGAKFARYYVIRNTRVPSVLVECGFVSNSGERKNMKQAWFRDAAAKGIADGIVKYRRSGVY